MKMRACLITNPRSGRGGIDLSTVLPILRGHGWDVIVRHKLKGGMATQLARQAAKEGCDVVVDCGGDGTLNEIVEGLVGTDTAVGTLPGGTINLWTRELGISSRLDVAAHQLVGAVRQPVDVGRVSINGGQRLHFLLMAGLGFDATVMSHVSKPLKNRIGKLAVGLAGLKSVTSFKPIPLQVEIGGINWQGHTGQIIVGNTRQYGGFTRFTPQAYVNDGLLDICMLTASGPLTLSRQIISLLFNQNPDLESAEIYRAGRIIVYAPTLVPLQLDGGAVKIKEKPTSEGMIYSFSVIAQGITVLVPATYKGDLFIKNSGTPNLSLASTKHKDTKQKPDENGKKEKPNIKAQIRVLELGVNFITGAKIKNGKVITVGLDSQTIVKSKGDGKVISDVTAVMSALEVGDVLKVKGFREQPKGKMLAQRITILGKVEPK